MLRRLAQQSGLYALVSVAAKLSGVVLLALYGDPAILPQADFGFLGGLDAVKTLALLLAGAGLPLGVIRFATASSLPPEQRAAVPATALVIAAVGGFLVGGLGWTFAPAVAAALLGDAALATPVRWLSLYVALRAIADVPYTQLRAEERAGWYALAGAAEALVLVASVAYFLLVAEEGLLGVMKGYVVTAGVLAGVLTPLVFRRLSWRVDWGLVRPLLAFGLPLVLSGLAGRFLNVGDRVLILRLLTPEANAVYEWAARFGGIVNVFLVQSFQMAFTVLGLKALDASGQPDLHRRAFRHFAALAGLAVLGLGLFLSDASRLLTDEAAYIGADGLALLIGAGFAFYGLYVVTVNVLYAAGKTQLVAVGVACAAVGNAALNLLLIPRLGIAGAAVATLAAYAGLAVWTAGRAERIVRAGYPWHAVVAVCVLVAGLWALAGPSADWALVPRLAARIGLLGLYLPLLVATGVYGRPDLDAVRAALRSRRASAPPDPPGAAPDEGPGAAGPIEPPPEPPGAAVR